MSELRIEYMPLREVRGWDRNPKGHDTAELEESFKRFGFVTPLILDEGTGQLVAGHGRLEALVALKELGEDPPDGIRLFHSDDWGVPVVRGVGFDDAKAAEAYLLADNRLVEAGGWDQAGLAAFLAEIQEDEDWGLVGLGWNDAEAQDLIAMAAPEPEAKAPIPTAPQREEAEAMETTEVKQITFFFQADVFDRTVQRMGELMPQAGANSFSELFLKMLENYEQ